MFVYTATHKKAAGIHSFGCRPTVAWTLFLLLRHLYAILAWRCILLYRDSYILKIPFSLVPWTFMEIWRFSESYEIRPEYFNS